MLIESELKQYAESYNDRWGIETGYRTKDRFLIKTNTPKYSIRVFFFLLSVLLYNIWVLLITKTNPKKLEHYEYWITTTKLRIVLRKHALGDYG